MKRNFRVKAQDAYPDYEMDEDEKEIAENDAKKARLHTQLSSQLPS